MPQPADLYRLVAGPAGALARLVASAHALADAPIWVVGPGPMIDAALAASQFGRGVSGVVMTSVASGTRQLQRELLLLRPRHRRAAESRGRTLRGLRDGHARSDRAATVGASGAPAKPAAPYRGIGGREEFAAGRKGAASRRADQINAPRLSQTPTLVGGVSGWRGRRVAVAARRGRGWIAIAARRGRRWIAVALAISARGGGGGGGGVVAAPVTAPVAPPIAAPRAAPCPPPTAPPIAAPAPAPSRPPPTARWPGSYGFVQPSQPQDEGRCDDAGSDQSIHLTSFRKVRRNNELKAKIVPVDICTLLVPSNFWMELPSFQLAGNSHGTARRNRHRRPARARPGDGVRPRSGGTPCRRGRPHRRRCRRRSRRRRPRQAEGQILPLVADLRRPADCDRVVADGAVAVWRRAHPRQQCRPHLHDDRPGPLPPGRAAEVLAGAGRHRARRHRDQLHRRRPDGPPRRAPHGRAGLGPHRQRDDQARHDEPRRTPRPTAPRRRRSKWRPRCGPRRSRAPA